MKITERDLVACNDLFLGKGEAIAVVDVQRGASTIVAGAKQAYNFRTCSVLSVVWYVSCNTGWDWRDNLDFVID